MAKKDNEHQIRGKIVHIGQVDYINERIQKRRLVIQTYAGYRDTEIQVVFLNKNMRHVDGLSQGNIVEIVFQLRGWSKVGGDGSRRWYVEAEGLSLVKV